MVASRKTKFAKSRRKGWRKVNIDDVEEFYEDQRLKQIVGIPDDQPLFTIEKKGEKIKIKELPESDAVEAKPQEPVKSRPLKTTKDIVKNAAIYRRLIPASKVEPITKMKMKSKHKRKVPEKIPKNVGKTIRKKLDTKPRDVWADGMIVKSKPNKKVPSLLPAVELPHPGTSVNPSRKDHRDLLRKAREIELARLKEEQHLNRVLTRYQKKAKSEKELQKEYIKDMSAGLFPANEVEVPNDNDENVGDLKNGPIKRVVRAEDRKSKAKRRREMIAKMEMERKKQEKEKRVKEAQVFQLKRYKKEIAAQEKLTQARIEERKKKEEEKMFQPHRLGPYKYKEPEIALNTTDELKGRLREVKTAGNPFEERFKSLQKRNLIEPRELIPKSFKKNVKYVLKRDHREDTDVY